MSSAFHENPNHDSIELLVIPESGVVYTNHPIKTNQVSTTKYTWYNFLPLNLWEQLTTLANLYFIFIGVLQTLKWTSTSGGVPTILTPLTTITVISGGRAAIENIHAAASDKKRNNQLFWQVASKIPHLFSHQIEIASQKQHGSSSRATPLLQSDLMEDRDDDEGTPLATHPQSLLHSLYQQYITLSKRLRRRWFTWETMDPTQAVHLPGLQLQPQQSTYAFKALQQKKEFSFANFFKKSSTPVVSPSTSPQDQLFSTPPQTVNATADSLNGNGSPSNAPYGSFGPGSPGSTNSFPLDSTNNEIANANAIAQRKAMLETNRTLELVHSGDLVPGSILKIYKNQMIPADLLLLGTSELRNHCFIDKANLNGETQLEVMNGIPYLKPYFGNTGGTTTTPSSSPQSQSSPQSPQSPQSPKQSTSLTLQTTPSDYSEGVTALGERLAHAPYYDVDLLLKYELPNADFESFRGVLSVYNHHKPSQQPFNITVSAKQLLLRETVLRNSDYIYGLVVYTGDDTKIRRSVVESNAKEKRSSTSMIKTSRLLHVINRLVAILFIFQIFLCFVAGITYSLWVYQNGASHWYLMLNSNLQESLLGALFSSLSWMIMVNTFVPISLLVTLEMTRFMTSIFIEWDNELFDTTINRTTKCNTTTVHDDLGIVDTVCSDKTGTLTMNRQEMRYISIAIHEVNDCHNVVGKDEYDAVKSTQPVDEVDSNQKKWLDKTSLQRDIYIKPLKSTTAFEAFGSLETEIAVRVKNKKAGRSINLLQSNLTTKAGSPIPYFQLPSTHPLAYQGLPPRWTQSLVEYGLVQPLKLFKDPKKKNRGEGDDDDDNQSSALQKQWTLAHLMSNSYKHNAPFFQRRMGPKFDDNQPLTRKSYSFFSYLWNTAQGHGFYQWFLSLQRAQGLKLAHEEATRLKKDSDDVNRSHLEQNRANNNNNNNNNTTLFSQYGVNPSSRTAVTTNNLMHSSVQYTTQQTDGTSIHTTRQATNNTPSSSATLSNNGSLHHSKVLSPRSNSTSPTQKNSEKHGSEMTLFAQHGAPARLDESMIMEPVVDGPTLVSTFGVSKSLHHLAAAGNLNPIARSNDNIRNTKNNLNEIDLSPSSQNGSNNTTTTTPIKFPNGIQVYNRLLFEKEYYLPQSSLLGAFRANSHKAILTALWSKNWAHLPEYRDQSIYIAPLNIRQHLYRYIRSLALSSTVKAYRKPDGTLDWQFESAEELAMTKFAASLGFYRDVHPSGEGVILYIREYFSPEFHGVDLDPVWKQIQQSGVQDIVDSDDVPPTPQSSSSPRDSSTKKTIFSSPSSFHGSNNKDDSNPHSIKLHNFKKMKSKIHAESYNSLAVCGFSSSRARVSIILQRAPQVTMPVLGSYTPLRADAPLPDYDSGQCLEGYCTINEYSTYISEYDRPFRDQSTIVTKTHPFDNLYDDSDDVVDAQSAVSYRQYPDSPEQVNITLKEQEVTLKKHIHVLTKGQDSTTIPLLQDTVMTALTGKLYDEEHNSGFSLMQSSSFFGASTTHLGTQDPHSNTLLYSNPHHSLKAQLYEMENSSLRCLVCAYAELPNEWWAQFETLFAFVSDLDVDTVLPITNLQQLVELIKANPSVNPNDLSTQGLSSPSSGTTSSTLKAVEVRHLAYQSIEEAASLSLLGCFGMEDQLQPLVPETIRDLRRAGIRVWMITGDKLDVAKNIALACELIDPDMLGASSQTISNESNQREEFNRTISGLGLTTGGIPGFAGSSAQLFAKGGSDMFDSNLITLNNPEIFPLCIRQHPSSRLINVTGEWLLNFRTNKDKLMVEVFSALTEYDESKNVLVELGYLQQCLLHVGLDLTLAQLGSMFILSRDDIKNFVTEVSATTTISRDRFVRAMNSIGESISDRDSILIDIEAGLKTYQTISLQHNNDFSSMPPIALLVNRNAFNIMFQDDQDAELSQFEFNAQRQVALIQAQGQSTTPPQQHHQEQQSHNSNNDSQEGTAVGFITPQSPISGNSSPSRVASPLRSAPPPPQHKTKRSDDLPWLAQKFFVLSVFAKSVVFARAEPAMKKKMVTSTRILFPSATTLAIGDGANDTDMITAAHIGIGIAGVEGTAASNSADYAIGTFRMLHRLLLVHGLTYQRIEKIILLMFYKGAAVAICHFLYGIHNSFNGSNLFNDMLYQMYNIIYTSWCVLLLIQHQPLPGPVLQNSPSVYRENKADSFTLTRFGYWMLKAVIHSMIIFYIPLLPLLFEGNELMGGTPLQFTNGTVIGARGRPLTLAHISTLQMCALAILPNIMACFMMESIQLPFFLIVGISALSIFGCIIGVTMSQWTGGDLYHDFTSLYMNPQFWLMLVLILALPSLLELIIHYVRNYWFDYPGIAQLLKERIYLRSKQIKYIDRHPEAHSTANGREATLFSPTNTNPGDYTPVVMEADRHNTSLAQSTTSSLIRPDQQNYSITTTPYDDTASTTDNIIETGLDVQLRGCDPDSEALYSATLFGEAAGHGVRATQAEEIISSNPYFSPTDKMNLLTHQAEALLKKLSHRDPSDVFIPTCLEEELAQSGNIQTVVEQTAALERMGLYSYNSDVLSRITALRVFRLLSLLTQSLDSDQQQQQKQNSAQSRQAMQKHGVAHYKRDRFQSSAGSSTLSTQTTTHPQHTQRHNVTNTHLKQKEQEDFGSIDNDDSEPTVLDQPFFVASQSQNYPNIDTYTSESSNNNQDGDDDNDQAVTISTAQQINPDVHTDHFQAQTSNGKRGKSGKGRK